MSVVKIFAITAGGGDYGDQLERLIEARAAAYQNHAGFLGLELLAPTDERDVWLFVTRWADTESFDDFVASPAFAGHAGADRVAAFGGPESATSEIWSFRLSLTTAT
jgi:heme oxygenase (mycobilin-producing)